MNRKALIVRGWLIVAAFLLLGVYDPILWFGVMPAAFLAHPCTPCCLSCTLLCDPEFSGDLEWQITGIVDGTSAQCVSTTCCLDGACDDLNALYITDFKNLGAVSCTWFDNRDSSCGVSSSFVRIADEGLTTLSYRISGSEVGHGSFSAIFIKEYSPGTLPDCGAWSSETIPFNSENIFPSCAFSGATVEVTAT